jgi:hypothetical protein
MVTDSQDHALRPAMLGLLERLGTGLETVAFNVDHTKWLDQTPFGTTTDNTVGVRVVHIIILTIDITRLNMMEDRDTCLY